MAKYNIQKAKEAGLSDEEINEYLSSQHPKFNMEKAKASGMSIGDLNRYLSQIEKQDESPSLKGSAGAYASGFAGGAGGVIPSTLNMIDAMGPFKYLVPGLNEAKEAAQNLGLKDTPELTEGFQKELIGKEPANSLERILQKGGEFGGQEALMGTAFGGPVGGVLGTAHGTSSGLLYQGLVEAGVEDNLALAITAAFTLSPIAAQKMISKYKASKEGLKAHSPKKPPSDEPPSGGSPADIKFEKDTFPSGLTKHEAIESPHAGKGIITSERQKKALTDLDKEAALLTKESVKKNLPIIEKIESGHDFQFQKRFGDLQKSAIKANPDIDITPISNFIRNIEKQYQGIPKELLDDDTRKILKEITAWRRNPQIGMGNLYKIFRINNKKISDIYERKLTQGKRKEYEDFLLGMNRAITDSFVRTLPEDSKWINEFLGLNAEYSEIQSATKTLRMLEPLLGGTATPSRLMKFSSDPVARKKLEVYMGKDGAAEITQIAKDLRAAKEGIHRIPVKNLSAWDAVFPLSMVIPGFQVPGLFATGKKAYDFSRRAYGLVLTSPARRRAYDQMLKSVANNDLSGYKEAASVLKE